MVTYAVPKPRTNGRVGAQACCAQCRANAPGRSKSAPPRHKENAFTLVELLVASTLAAFVLAGVLTTHLQLLKSGVRITQYAEMSAQIRRGFEQLEGDVRSATAIKWNSASDVTLTVANLDGTTRQVTYAWTSALQAFFLVPGADSTVTPGRILLVRGVPALADGSAGVTFSRYDRDGVAATTDVATKSVQVTISVVRTARTAANSTDTAVSTIFILRNKPAS